MWDSAKSIHLRVDRPAFSAGTIRSRDAALPRTLGGAAASSWGCLGSMTPPPRRTVHARLRWARGRRSRPVLGIGTRRVLSRRGRCQNPPMPSPAPFPSISMQLDQQWSASPSDAEGRGGWEERFWAAMEAMGGRDSDSGDVWAAILSDIEGGDIGEYDTGGVVTLGTENGRSAKAARNTHGYSFPAELSMDNSSAPGSSTGAVQQLTSAHVNGVLRANGHAAASEGYLPVTRPLSLPLRPPDVLLERLHMR